MSFTGLFLNISKSSHLQYDCFFVWRKAHLSDWPWLCVSFICLFLNIIMKSSSTWLFLTVDPRCHVHTCFWYPNKKSFFGTLKSSHFSMWRFLREGLGCQTKTCFWHSKTAIFVWVPKAKSKCQSINEPSVKKQSHWRWLDFDIQKHFYKRCTQPRLVVSSPMREGLGCQTKTCF